MDENERNAFSSVPASRLRVVDKCVVDGAQLLHFVIWFGTCNRWK